MIRSYTELCTISSFEERFKYLRLNGFVGESTFGFDRHINQKFYTSVQWRQVRNSIIARDLGCDLGVEGYEIYDKIIIHHMNPMSIQDLVDDDEDILNPEYLITTRHRTHNAIHYGDESLLFKPPEERKPGDTLLWKPIKRKHGID